MLWEQAPIVEKPAWESAPLAEEPEQPKEEGFLTRAGERLGERGQSLIDTGQSFAQGDIGKYQAMIQTGGQIAGGALDVMGEGISSVFNTVGEAIPDAIKDPVKRTIVEQLSNLAQSDVGKQATEIMKEGTEAWEGFKQENPNAAKTIESAVNLGLIVAPAKIKSGPPGRISKIAESIKNKTVTRLRTRAAKKLLNEAAPTVDGLKKAARTIYDQIDSSGTVISADRISNLAGTLRKTAKSEGFNKVLHPKVNVLLNQFDDAAGNLPVGEVDTLRKIAQAAAGSLDKSERRLGKLLINKIDDALDDLTPKDLIGGTKEVGSMYKDARNLWQRASKAELLDEAIEGAKSAASGFENGLRIEFRKILKSKKKRRGFNMAEIAAMRQVEHGTKAGNFAKTVGKLGISLEDHSAGLMALIGAGGGGLAAGGPGAAAVLATGTFSKSLAKKLTANNAQAAKIVVSAGNDGLELSKAYLKAFPKNRNVKDLTELLLRPGVSLKKLKSLSKPSKALDIPIDEKRFIAVAASNALVTDIKQDIKSAQEDSALSNREKRIKIKELKDDMSEVFEDAKKTMDRQQFRELRKTAR